MRPFDNCKFDHCDLPGQCQAEGKCHHPSTTPQDWPEEPPNWSSRCHADVGKYIAALRTKLTEAERRNAELVAAIQNLRDVKGRYHTEQATNLLFGLIAKGGQNG